MRVTLSEFLRLSTADQACVTHLDLICDGDVKRYWRTRHNQRLDDCEEYEGEALDRGLL